MTGLSKLLNSVISSAIAPRSAVPAIVHSSKDPKLQLNMESGVAICKNGSLIFAAALSGGVKMVRRHGGKLRVLRLRVTRRRRRRLVQSRMRAIWGVTKGTKPSNSSIVCITS